MNAPDLRRHRLKDTVIRVLGSADPRWASFVAQNHAPDVVLAAGLFQPNVAGHYEMSSWSGFRQRQVMKSRAMHVWSRVILALTPLDLIAVEVVFGAALCPARERWALSKIRTRAIDPASRADGEWPAVRIEASNGRILTELRPLRHDESTADLLTRLVGPPSARPAGF